MVLNSKFEYTILIMLATTITLQRLANAEGIIYDLEQFNSEKDRLWET
jgi:hypothetical protein